MIIPMTLHLGSAGHEVEVLHQLLVEQGFDPGEDEWSSPRTFGPETESSVMQFQSTHVSSSGHHLKADGVVGPQTWWSLEHPSEENQHTHDLESCPVQPASNLVAAKALVAFWGEYRLNTHEVPDGSNRGPRIDVYTGMEGKGYAIDVPGPPWCAYLVSWCFAQSPGGSPFGRQGNAQAIAAYCENHIPQSVVRSLIPGEAIRPERVHAGDIGIIANGPVKGHATMVLAVEGDMLWTGEGNSGNACRIRKRHISQFSCFVNFDDYASKLTLATGPDGKVVGI
jgi:hypothetical protein